MTAFDDYAWLVYTLEPLIDMTYEETTQLRGLMEEWSQSPDSA